MLRGCAWNNNAANCRAAQRNNNSLDNRNNNVGFRPASARYRIGEIPEAYGPLVSAKVVTMSLSPAPASAGRSV
ncbi:MAG: hypothetical protein AAF449_01360 [Myxococcota bacterium]